MRKVYKRIISFVLVVTMLVCSSLPVFAAEVEEEYLSDLRLVYADDYDEAKEALVGTDFEDYKVFNYNLNNETDKAGVWLAYKTTTDIDDAITDLSIMQMDGGYREGNYQEMIKESLAEYEEMGENYVQAIDYFIEAYDEGHFLAELAYRQLNFYTSITDESLGIEIPDFDGEHLGDVFYDGITASELATIFMEGNSYALDNIRSLLAMGVSYNENGKHYLQNVEEAVSIFENDAEEFEYHDYYDDFDDLAFVIASSIKNYRKQFEELATYEPEMNYYDGEVTELELKYLDIKSVADRFREVSYIEGETLYDFCMDFEYDEDDLSPLYPLVWALNEGQIAMVKVAHYSDVVRYSMSDYPEEELIAEVEKLEDYYNEYPFNVYTGVDRSIFYGTFALTSDAYRADAYTGEGLLNHIFNKNGDTTLMAINTGMAGTVFGYWAISRTQEAINHHITLNAAKDFVANAQTTKGLMLDTIQESYSALSSSYYSGLSTYGNTCGEAVNTLLKDVCGQTYFNAFQSQPLTTKMAYLRSHPNVNNHLTPDQINSLDQLINDATHAQGSAGGNIETASKGVSEGVIAQGGVSKLALFGTGMLYVVSAAFMLYSAYNIGHTVWNYYHPEYKDIPTSLVDLIETVDGDRYIKYDVVYNAETNDDGVYEAADLNAFEGQRWNALYYTKSYEAGKPLLADAFAVSTSNSTPREGYTPVHRFGELVCYNLNKYTYGFTPSIYLSVKQSKNDKSAVADVPEVVGSMIGTGFILLAGGVGAVAGIGGTLGTLELMKKKKNKATTAELTSEE